MGGVGRDAGARVRRDGRCGGAGREKGIAADEQGKGYGRYAVDAAKAEACARGVDRITVLWERGDGGPEPFYLKLGFTPTGDELAGEVVAEPQL